MTRKARAPGASVRAQPQEREARRGRERRPLVRTGVAGLDHILRGGLPSERYYLLGGDPGTGKTTLALQFLLEGRDRGERSVYVTLAETTRELEDAASSHGWSLEGIEIVDTDSALESPSAASQYTVFHPSEVELQDTIDRVLARIEAARPTRVALDSLSDMRLLARDPLRFRRQILALKQFFASRGITALLLDDQTADEPDMQLHSLVHGVILLDAVALSHGSAHRRLRVTKLRGVAFHEGYHDFCIRTGGVQVFPRLQPRTDVAPVRRRLLKSGAAEIDALLGGGVPAGSSVLLTGAPGTGKSVLATQFAAAAGARGESAAVYIFDERVGTYLERAQGLKMKLGPLVRSGRIRLNPLEPTEISPGEFTWRVIRAVEDGCKVIVIDSLNGLTKAMPEERQLGAKLHELLSYLGAKGITTFMTLAQRGMFGTAPEDAAEVSYLADAVVQLRYFESMGEVRRAISVFKQRSGDHERTVREFRLGPGGFDLGEPLREFQGVLTGVPTFTGVRSDLFVEGEAGRAVERLPAARRSGRRKPGRDGR